LSTSTTILENVTAQRKKWDEMLVKQADPARSKDRIQTPPNSVSGVEIVTEFTPTIPDCMASPAS
jgi:hypothetical protein